MVNNRGQKKMNGITMFIMVFVLAILGVLFLQSIADSTTKITTILGATNQTVTFSAANTTVNLNGKFVDVDTLVAINSSGALIATCNGAAGNYSAAACVYGNGNFTVKNNQNVGGIHTSTIEIVDTGNVGSYNMSYTYQPLGYITNSAGRSITTLLVVIFAIGLLFFVIAKFFGTDNFKKIMGVGR